MYLHFLTRCAIILWLSGNFTPTENEGRRHSDVVNDYIHPCCTFALSDLVIEVPGEYLK